MALDATVGGANSNSYVTQAAATTYFTDHLANATWTAATSGTKDAALIMATTRLDVEHYVGARTFIDQRLKWPRYGAYDADGILFDHNAIPLPVQQATYELALALVRVPTLLDDTGLLSYINVKVGSLDVTPRGIQTAPMPQLVKQLIASVRLGGYGTPVRRA